MTTRLYVSLLSLLGHQPKIPSLRYAEKQKLLYLGLLPSEEIPMALKHTRRFRSISSFVGRTLGTGEMLTLISYCQVSTVIPGVHERGQWAHFRIWG